MRTLPRRLQEFVTLVAIATLPLFAACGSDNQVGTGDTGVEQDTDTGSGDTGEDGDTDTGEGGDTDTGDGDTDTGDGDTDTGDGDTSEGGVCGDGVVDDGEECDDGNTVSGDGCSSDCKVETPVEEGQACYPCANDGECNDGFLCGEHLDGEFCALDCSDDASVCGTGTECVLIARDAGGDETETVGLCLPAERRCTAASCGDGIVDDGEECDDGNNLDDDGCSSTCTIEAFCGNGVVDDGEECDGGTWCSTDCQIIPGCGNGIVESGEDCDGTEDCEADCTFKPYCGDGNIDPGEDCDGGEWCTEDCAHIPHCGDGVLDDGEECDGGEWCTLDCQFITGCGNGVVESGEQCDDGNTDNGDGCSSDCQLEATFCLGKVIDASTHDTPVTGILVSGAPSHHEGVCGNRGAPDDTWELHAWATGRYEIATTGSGINTVLRTKLGCFDDEIDCNDNEVHPRLGVLQTSFMTVDLVEGERLLIVVDGQNMGVSGPYQLSVNLQDCGDGYMTRNEQCDEGDNESSLHCSTSCMIQAYCGNGIVDPGEECDDGNNLDDDGCSAICEFEYVCGDGVVAGDEECDDGNTDNGDGCSSDCLLEWVCGNGTVDPNEDCDDGNAVSGDGCSNRCLWESTCGNGIIEPGEECDDNNIADGDGCNSSCFMENRPVDAGGVFKGGFKAASKLTYSLTVHNNSTWVELTTGDEIGGCPEDTVLRVRNAANIVVAESDDAPGFGRCSHIARTLPPGEYKIEVSGYTGRKIDRFWLYASVHTDMAATGNYGGGLNTLPDDQDRFLFTLDTARRVSLSTGDGRDGCPGDTQMELYNVATDALVAASDDFAPIAPCSLIDDTLPAGDYELIVTGASAFNYQLSYRHPPATCGNGSVDSGEQCDDGNNIPGDGCAADCTWEFECGDGILDAGEQCDDGNNVDGDGCAANCTLEWICGDGVVDPNEVCDGQPGCGPDCTYTGTRCGNNIIEPGEECDDGGKIDNDGCSSACYHDKLRIDNGGRFNGGFILGGFAQFEFTVHNTPTRFTAKVSDGGWICPSSNVKMELIRNGTVHTSTQGSCIPMDLTLNPGDYTLKITSPGQLMDRFVLDTELWVNITNAGNYLGGLRIDHVDTYKLSNATPRVIQLETHDGIGGCTGTNTIKLYDAAGNKLAEATGTCTSLAWPIGVGNYVVKVSPAAGSGIPAYTLGVSYGARGCGDGIVEAPEQCDDGNNLNGDGCSSTCRLEYTCGDGIREAGEQCDWGTGNEDGGGCNTGCYKDFTNIDTPDAYEAGWGTNGEMLFNMVVSHNPTRVVLWTDNGVGGCPGNTLIEIKNAGGAVVASNDDGGSIGGGCSLLDTNITVPGNYDVIVRHPDGDAMAGVFLNSEIWVDVPGNGQYQGQVLAAGWDEFRFTLTNTATVRMETLTGVGQCDVETYAMLFDESGDFVAEDFSHNGIGQCSKIQGTFPPGDYVLQIQGWGGFSAVPPYYVDFEFSY